MAAADIGRGFAIMSWEGTPRNQRGDERLPAQMFESSSLESKVFEASEPASKRKEGFSIYILHWSITVAPHCYQLFYCSSGPTHNNPQNLISFKCRSNNVASFLQLFFQMDKFLLQDGSELQTHLGVGNYQSLLSRSQGVLPSCSILYEEWRDIPMGTTHRFSMCLLVE